MLQYIQTLKAPSTDFVKPVISAQCGLLKLMSIACESLVDEVCSMINYFIECVFYLLL